MTTSEQLQKYRAAIIACGRISRAHARGYLANSGIEISSCADISSEALEKFGSEFNIPKDKRYLDYNQMLENEKPDLVSICSLHDLHASMTIDAARYKPKAIFCEKPIALNLGEADAMIEACKSSGTLLIIGHQRRFAPQYIAAYNALNDGAIGELKSIETHGHPFCSLLVDGTHTVDLVRWYAGEVPVQWVMGQIDVKTKRTAWGSLVEDAAMMLLGFESGVRAFMTLGSLISNNDPLWPEVPPGTYHLLILSGTDGQIEIDGDAPVEGRPWVRLIHNGEVEEIPLHRTGESPHALVVKGILENLEEGKHHTLEAQSARATLEVLMAVYESSRSRSIIELPLDIDENPMFDMVDKGII